MATQLSAKNMREEELPTIGLKKFTAGPFHIYLRKATFFM